MDLAKQRDVQEHLAKVRKRLADDDLSAIELQHRYEDRVKESQSLSGERRRLLMAETEIIKGMIDSATAPEPTPQDRVADMRERGLHNAADELEYNIVLNRKNQVIWDNLSEAAELERGEVDGHTQRKIDRLRAEADTLQQQKTPSPYATKTAQAAELTTQRREKDRQAAHAEEDGNRDKAKQLRGEILELKAQADQIFSDGGPADVG